MRRSAFNRAPTLMDQPRFINPDTLTVYVHDARGTQVPVPPIRMLENRPTDPDLRRACIREGQHYARYAGEGGSLVLFPADVEGRLCSYLGISPPLPVEVPVPDPVAALPGATGARARLPGGVVARAVDPVPSVAACAAAGRIKITGDVVASHGEVKRDTVSPPRVIEDAVLVLAPGMREALHKHGITTVAELADTTQPELAEPAKRARAMLGRNDAAESEAQPSAEDEESEDLTKRPRKRARHAS